ncbi:MAG: FAD-dependent monooxygenase [Halorhodospira sp.]
MSSQTYDVILAGAGLVGGALACALADGGARVAVIEAASLQDHGQPSFDCRHTALAPSSRYILEAWALWQPLRGALTPIRHIHISEQGGWGFTHLDAAAEGLGALGWVLPNRRLGEAVIQRLTAHSTQVTLQSPGWITQLEHTDEAVTVTVERPDTSAQLRGRLLVITDGAESRTRELAGLSTRRRDYGQSALFTTLTPGRNPQGWAYERFSREGPLAMLPIAQGRCAVIWSLPHARAQHYAEGGEQALLAGLQAAFGHRLGRLRACDPPRSYALREVLASRLTATRVALAGNAAHTLHPVAAQGLNLSLRDAATLAELVLAQLRKGGDPGEAALLQRYACQRRPDIRRTQWLTDGLVRGFSLDTAPLRLIRSGALAALERIDPARRALMRAAGGRIGPLPAIACRPPEATDEEGEAM